jgi:3-hydroxymyristoyl/3-hydroxydecanoyl-(acyl carrier protein) dehydratase
VRGIGKFRTRATVGEQLVCEAQLLAAIRDVPPQPALPV